MHIAEHPDLSMLFDTTGVHDGLRHRTSRCSSLGIVLRERCASGAPPETDRHGCEAAKDVSHARYLHVTRGKACAMRVEIGTAPK